MNRKRYKKEDSLAPKILTAQFLLFANAVIWLGFGVYLFVDMVKAHNTASVIFLISFFLLVNAGAMAFCGVTIGRRDSWAYYFSLFILVVNAIFTRLGQFEVFDLLAFIFDIAVLVFLLTIGKDYLKAS
ncbi:MAG: hypothetical protein JNM55_19040 [Anaerolineales bacterium]|nr:hypothetical protein [Anaerolineales bacterium]